MGLCVLYQHTDLITQKPDSVATGVTGQLQLTGHVRLQLKTHHALVISFPKRRYFFFPLLCADLWRRERPFHRHVARWDSSIQLFRLIIFRNQNIKEFLQNDSTWTWKNDLRERKQICLCIFLSLQIEEKRSGLC